MKSMSEWLKSAQLQCDEYHQLMQDLEQACEERFVPLTGQQAMILLGIGSKGHCAVKHIKYAGTNASYNISRLRDFEVIDYVVGDDDRRVRYLSLTEKGRRLYQEIIQHFESIDASA
jgi:DNA-binding MarR family transcriptional regulator